tara:strand:+ start:840 stop:980 length:141 start_codon:yes stop_codon:yes gene_type:complete
MILSHNFSLQNSQLRYLKEKVRRLIEEKGEPEIEENIGIDCGNKRR